MRKFLLATMAILWLLTSLGGKLVAQENIAVWKFPAGVTDVTCVSDMISATDCSFSSEGTVSASGTNNSNTSLCGDTDDTKSLQVSGQAGGSIVFKISAAPFRSISISYDLRGHPNMTYHGYTDYVWSYSTNGTTFTDAPAATAITGFTETTFTAQTADFSSISALNGSNEVWFKLTMSGAEGASVASNIDNVVISGFPMTCLTPVNVSAVAENTNSATISWEPQGTNEESYTLVYYTGSLGATTLNSMVEINSSNVIANVTSPYTLTGLNANTTYYVYVRANCGGNDNSLWSQGVSFTTPEPVVHVITIGDGTGTGYQAPVNTFYNYSLSQQIYTPDDIEMAGTISSVAFYYDYTSSFSMAGIKLYMKHTTKSSFASNSDMVSLDDATLVYDGVFGAEGAGWITLPLSTPFEYNGTDNLLICMYDQTSGYPGSSYKFRYTSTGDNYTSIMYYSDSYTPDINNVSSFSGSKTYNKYHNNIQLGIAPNGNVCFRVSDVVATNLTASSAVIGWTAGAEETAWVLKYGLAGFDVESAGTEVSVETTPSYSLSGLSANTTYDVYVKAICGDTEESRWTKVSFTTYCSTQSIPYTQNFEGFDNYALPSCWTRLASYTSGTYTYPCVYNSTTYGLDGSAKSLRMYTYYSNNAPENIIAMPPMDDINTLQVSFWARYYSTNPQSFQLGYVKNGEFTAVQTITSLTTTYQQFIVYLNAVPADAEAIAFRSYHATSSSYVHIDDIEVSPLPTCVEPQNIVVSNITATTASISWTDVLPTTAWQYQLGDGDITDIDAKPIELTGLNANTEYTIKVRSACGVDYSDWTTTTFRSACESIVTFPWTENFENLSANTSTSYSATYAVNAPCWENEHISGGGSYLFHITSYAQAGNSTNKLQLPDMSNGTQTKLVLPVMNLSDEHSYVFGIDIYRSTSGTSYTSEGVRVFASANGEIEGATELGFLYRNCGQTDGNVVTAEASTGWYSYLFDIPFTGTCYIILRGESQYGTSTYMDNLIVREKSSLAEITAFSFAEDADVAVINSADATVTSLVSYQTESLNGLVPTIAISDYATIAPASGVAQDFTGPVTYTVTAEDGTTTKEWTVNVSKVATASTAKDILSFTFSGQSRETDIDVENHTVTAYAAWNYDFANNIAPTITVSPQATIYPVSDSSINFATPVTYTVTAEDESTQDWTVTIINDPYACVNPLASTFTAPEIAPTSATIAWWHRYLETSYNVKISTTAMTDMTATANTFDGVVNDTTITLTGLAENTLYYVYVQSACGIETWTSYSFRTIITPATVPYSHAFEDATENNSWVLINGSQTNKWYIGTASSNSGNGLYISNDNGTTNAYTVDLLSFAYAYRTISMETGDYVVSYKWKAQGESQYYDFIRVWLAPASFAFTAGQSPNGGTSVYDYWSGNNPSGWISLDESHSLNQVSSWQSQTLTASVPAGTYNLVFMWANDGSGGSQPPASIDNISITQITCPVVSNLEASNITTTSADITWTERGTATAWDVVFSAEELGDTQLAAATPEYVDAASYQATELTQNTPYYIYVRARCSAEDQSEWVALQFRTECGENAIPYTQNFNDYAATGYSTAGVMPDCWRVNYSGTSQNYAPHVCNYTYYAPGTDNYIIMVAAQNETVGQYSYAIFPHVEGGYANRFVSFDKRISSVSNGTLSLGYMNGNNFVSLTDVTVTTAGTSFSYVVPNTVPAEVTLAFRLAATSTSYAYLGIDNVFVRETSSDNTILSYSASTDQGNAICSVDNEAHTISVELRSGYVAGNGIRQIIVPNDENAIVQQQTATDFVTPPNYLQWFMTTADTAVVYKVTAENGAEQLYNATITVESCAAPSVLASEQTSATNVNCSWTPAEGTSAWDFYCSTTQLTPADLNALTSSDYTIVNVANTSYTVTGETTYYWYVRTDCDGSYSAWQESSFTTWENCVAPTNINTAVINDNDIVVSWNVQDNLPLGEAYGIGADSFERNQVSEGSLSYTNGTYPWSIVSADAHSGSKCLVSASGNHSTTSEITATVNYDEPFEFSFWYKVSSESGWDYFYFYLDGEQKLSQSGTVAWSQYTTTLAAGSHTLSWRYTKDGSTSSGSDCVWIDDVTLPMYMMVPGGNSSVVVYRNDVELATVPATQTHYTDEGLETGNYCYTIKTICRAGSESDFSAPVCQDITSCLAVTNMSATNVTANSATISWARGDAETAWNITVNGGSPIALTEASEGVTVNGNVITYDVAGLEPMTDNTVAVQSDCGGSLSQSWTSINFTTDRVPATLPYICNFEDAVQNNGWVLVNGTQTNKWYIGTAVNHGGANGLYITNDNGTTNAYTTSAAQFVYAYRQIAVPATSDYVVSYDWKANGEGNYDYIRVWLAPTTATLTAGQLPNGSTSANSYTSTTPTGWISLDGGSKLNLVSSWQTENMTLTIPEGNYNLVFMWANDGSGGTQPPAAIDNIDVHEVSCPTVGELVADASGITNNSAVITWVERGSAEAWEIIVSSSSLSDSQLASAESVTVTGTTYSATGLNAVTTYYVYVRANCDASDNSEWVNTTFSTVAACATPDGLQATNVSATSATITWNGYTASQWTLEYRIGTAGTWTPVESINESSYTLTTVGNTTYNVRIKAVCGVDEASDYSAILSFTTPCEALTVDEDHPYTEGFESTAAYEIPSCWERIVSYNSGTYEYPYVYNYSTYSHESTNSLRMYTYYYNAPENVIAMPRMNNINTLQVSFWARYYSTNPQSFQIGYVKNGVFTAVETLSLTATHQKFTVYMNEVPADAEAIAFRSYHATSSAYAHIDDINVSVIPTCVEPANVAASNVLSETASITWTDVNPATAWQYQLNGGDVVDVDAQPIELTGLTANTEYTVNVRTVCGTDEYSAWSNVTFVTACDIISALPWSENFNSLSSGIPNCWDNTEGTTTTDSYKWNFYSTGHDGAGLRFNSYTNSSGNTNMLKTPIFDLSAYDGAVLKFWYKNPAGGDFSVYVSTDGGTTYTQNTLATGLTGTSSWTEMTYDLSQYMVSNVVVVFKGTSNYGYDDAYIYLDDVSIHEPSSDAEIVAFSFAEEVEPAVINSTDATVTSVVAYSTASLNGLVPTISVSDFATISPASGVAQDFTSPVTYTVTAEDGTIKEWTVNVSKMANASSEKDILSFTFNGQVGESVIDATAHTVTATASFNVNIASVTPAIEVSPMATISPASGVAQDFSTPVTYIVTAEDETTQEWIVTITQNEESLASLPYSCDFEDVAENANWILENGTQANMWYIGTATNNGGANGLYISSNNGVSNTYNTNSETYSYAYRPIEVEEAGHYDISFDWKSNGEEYYDFLRAFAVPVSASQNLVAGEDNGIEAYYSTGYVPTGWIDIANPAGELSAETTWQHSEKAVALETGIYNVVFFWENDLSDGDQAPAAIDNISIERSTFTITASAEGFGSIEPSGEISVADGATQSFTMTPIAGFALSSLLIDGVDQLSQVVNNTYTFENVSADHTIVAYFDAEHIITATAGNGGTISPAGQVTVGNGGNMTFTVTADEGYVVSSVLVDNVEQITDDVVRTTFNYPFTNVTEDHTIAASFVTAPSHIITATASAGGSISPSGQVTVPYNGSQTFEFTPDEGYRLANIVVDNGPATAENNTYTFTNVIEDHTITANFAVNSYNLTIHYVYADNTTAAPDHTETVAFGTEYSVASPAIAGYTADPETVAGTMPAQDVEVTVTYNANSYTLTIHYVYADNTTAAPDHTETVAFGATYSVESPVLDGYTADQLTVAGTMPAEDVTVTVTYTANAPETYTLTIHYVYADNTTAADDHVETLAAGATYSVASPVIDGYTADQPTVAGTMPAQNVEVTVRYTANSTETYTLTIHYVYADNNTTAAADHVETLAVGATYSVASPVINGYTADQPTVAGTMPAQNVEVTVRYTANTTETYTLTIHYVYADNTTAAADHVETLAEGATYSVASPAIAGYTADQATVAGTMPAQDVEVTVRYTASSSTTYTIIATAGANGTITPSDIVYVPEGANQTFRITPNSGYRIATVMVDGVNAMDDVVDNLYTFYNVRADHSIDVTFTNSDAVDEYTAGSLSVYPNPNNGMFSIDFANINGEATYQLIDARGAIVETRDINVMNGDTMNFSYELRPGAYFVRVITADRVYVEQIVVE